MRDKHFAINHVRTMVDASAGSKSIDLPEQVEKYRFVCCCVVYGSSLNIAGILDVVVLRQAASALFTMQIIMDTF